jgi:hypothetical protein
MLQEAAKWQSKRLVAHWPKLLSGVLGSQGETCREQALHCFGRGGRGGYFVKATLASAAIVLALAGHGGAQTVEFRIVERTGQTQVSSADALLELAVQARVTPGPLGSYLGGFNFNIVLSPEPEANGTLQKARIMAGYVFGVGNAYYTGTPWAPNSIVGVGGIAGQFSYLAGISGTFNGYINMSGGTFTNGPDQEIGVIAGAATGNALLQTPGIDSDGNSVPDTAPSNGTGLSANNEVAPLDPSLAGTYFADGQFIDIYRFRYTVTNFAPRVFTITVEDAGAQVFDQLLFNNGAWGGENHSLPGVDLTITPLIIVVGAIGSCCDSLGSCTLVEQSGCAAGSVWTLGATCTPNPCPHPGTCCGAIGLCLFVFQSACGIEATWSQGGTCQPSPCPQPGACCDSLGACALALQASCAGDWSSVGTCAPNPCPQPGSCCEPDGTCSFGFESVCASGSTWMQSGTCSPNVCPRPGTCCGPTGECSFTYSAMCGTDFMWTVDGACSPNPCPQPGACCRGAICEVNVVFNCAERNTRFAGVGISCNAQGNVQVPCCFADFNQSGTVTVADIMDFINAWLAGIPWTDVNGYGGANVADIFEFLTAWFAGCN